MHFLEGSSLFGVGAEGLAFSRGEIMAVSAKRLEKPC
ncbi:hypothetical protein EV701_14719, partial [Chthoniobacter flavus]